MITIIKLKKLEDLLVFRMDHPMLFVKCVTQVKKLLIVTLSSPVSLSKKYGSKL
jgi:hypothetical protein